MNQPRRQIGAHEVPAGAIAIAAAEARNRGADTLKINLMNWEVIGVEDEKPVTGVTRCKRRATP